MKIKVEQKAFQLKEKGHSVLFRLIKKCSFNLLCVFNLIEVLFFPSTSSCSIYICHADGGSLRGTGAALSQTVFHPYWRSAILLSAGKCPSIVRSAILLGAGKFLPIVQECYTLSIGKFPPIAQERYATRYRQFPPIAYERYITHYKQMSIHSAGALYCTVQANFHPQCRSAKLLSTGKFHFQCRSAILLSTGKFSLKVQECYTAQCRQISTHSVAVLYCSVQANLHPQYSSAILLSTGKFPPIVQQCYTAQYSPKADARRGSTRL